MPLGQKIDAFYRANIGQAESPRGSNRGVFVDKCLRDGAHVDPTQGSVDDHQWCAAMYCLALVMVGVVGIHTASTGGLFALAKARKGVIYDPRQPKSATNNPANIRVGDAALELAPADKPTKTGFCHTTEVSDVANLDRGILHTISGNRGDCVSRGDYLLSRMVVVRFAE